MKYNIFVNLNVNGEETIELFDSVDWYNHWFENGFLVLQMGTEKGVQLGIFNPRYLTSFNSIPQ